MKALTKSNLKYLYALPVALLILFLMYFQYSYAQRHEEALSEKMLEKRIQVQLIVDSIATYVERDDDWGEYDYKSIVAAQVEELDKMYGVFAAVYDDKLQLLSERFLSDTDADIDRYLFDPTKFADFIITAAYNNEGELELPYDRGPDTVPSYMFFMWVPPNQVYEHRLLVVVGITSDSVQTHPNVMIVVGIVALTAATFLLNMAMITIIIYEVKLRENRRRNTDDDCDATSGAGSDSASVKSEE